MDDNKLKTLFSNFDPELSSDAQFMNKLQRSLNSVEIIKQHNAEFRTRNKIALVIATIFGIFIGFLLSLSLPYLSDAMSDLKLTLPNDSVLKTLANNFTIIAWLVVGGSSVLMALNAYEISLSLFKPKDTTTCKL